MAMFSNRENERIELPDGRVIYLSRSAATASTIVAIKDGVPHYLLVQRGIGVPDEQGRWCLPCGYLDWDESLVDGARREIWEETNFDISEFTTQNEDTESLLLNMDFETGQPWFVNSNPDSDAKQNITNFFGFIFEVTDEFPELSSVNAVPNEVADLRWVSVNDLGNYDIAFNHDKRINSYGDVVDSVKQILDMK